MINSTFYFAFAITFLFSFATAFYYYLKYHRRDLAVSVVLYSLFIFSIVYLVSFEGNLGLGIGLLGILSIIRFRSIPENLIDIGFIFYAIALGLLNASIDDYVSMAIADAMLTVVLILMTYGFLFKKDLIKVELILDEIPLDQLNDRKNLMKLIEKKYSICPVSVQVLRVDYLKDSVTLEVFHQL